VVSLASILKEVFQANTLKEVFQANTLKEVFQANTLKVAFQANTLKVAFQANTLKVAFQANTLKVVFQASTHLRASSDLKVPLGRILVLQVSTHKARRGNIRKGFPLGNSARASRAWVWVLDLALVVPDLASGLVASHLRELVQELPSGVASLLRELVLELASGLAAHRQALA